MRALLSLLRTLTPSGGAEPSAPCRALLARLALLDALAAMLGAALPALGTARTRHGAGSAPAAPADGVRRADGRPGGESAHVGASPSASPPLLTEIFWQVRSPRISQRRPLDSPRPLLELPTAGSSATRATPRAPSDASPRSAWAAAKAKAKATLSARTAWWAMLVGRRAIRCGCAAASCRRGPRPPSPSQLGSCCRGADSR